MRIVKLDVGDTLQMKKKHPCSSDSFKITHLGSDVKIVCDGCQRSLMLPREKLEKRTRLIIKDVKILYNTIDKAIETVRLSGIDVQTLRRENTKDTEIVIRIPKYA